MNIINELARLKVTGGNRKITQVIMNKDNNIDSIQGLYVYTSIEVEFNLKYKYINGELKSIIEKYIDFNGSKIKITYDKAFNKKYEKFIYANSSTEKMYDINGRLYNITNYFSNGEIKDSTVYRYTTTEKDIIISTHTDNRTGLITESTFDNADITDCNISNEVIRTESEGILCSKTYYTTGNLKCIIGYSDNRTKKIYSNKIEYYKNGELVKYSIINKDTKEGVFRSIYMTSDYANNDKLLSITINDADSGIKTIQWFKDNITVEEKIIEPVLKQKGSIMTKVRLEYKSDTNSIIKSYCNRYVYNGHRWRILDKKEYSNEVSTIIEYKNEKSQSIITTTNVDSNKEVSVKTTVLDKWRNIIKETSTNNTDNIIIDDNIYKRSNILYNNTKVLVLSES